MNKSESFDQMLPLLNETTITCIMRQKAPMIDMNSAQQKYLYGNSSGKSVNLFFFSLKGSSGHYYLS